MQVAFLCFHGTRGMGALSTTIGGRHPHSESAVSETPFAWGITLAPWAKRTDARCRASLSVAVPFDHIQVFVRTSFSIILSHSSVEVKGSLLTTTTFNRAFRPWTSRANAVNWAWFAHTLLRVAFLVAVWALSATVRSRTCNVIDALCDAISAGGGAGTELGPFAFTILRAAVVVASL